MRRFGRPHSQLEKTAPLPSSLGDSEEWEWARFWSTRHVPTPIRRKGSLATEKRPVEAASEPRPKRRRRSSITVKRTRSTLLT
jgi:hypothetical protein